jgi:hypothetical protein
MAHLLTVHIILHAGLHCTRSHSRNTCKEVVLKAINEKSISKNTNYFNINFGGGIREILDWLQHPSTPKQNLRELTFKEALEKAKAAAEKLSERPRSKK